MLGALKTENSPFNDQQIQNLKQALGGLSESQSLWLSGFLAGRLASDPAQEAEAGNSPVLHVFFGTETGNGETLAERFSETAGAAGINVELLNLDGIRAKQLGKINDAVFIVSTHGEGDPPEEALDFFEQLGAKRAPGLGHLRYRVLALGDSSYEQFCEAGRWLDEKLAELGAQRIAPRVECDVDFNPAYEAWSTELIGWAHDHLAITPARQAPHLSLVSSSPAWTRETPFEAEILGQQKISGRGSPKDVYHLELSLEDSGLQYEPGDALGVWVRNDEDMVKEIIDTLALTGTAPIASADRTRPLLEVLTEERELTRLTPHTVLAYAEATKQEALVEHFSGLSGDARSAFLATRQFADLVQEYPGKLTAEELTGLLRPLTPRSYSIASSQRAVDDAVELTIATLESQSQGPRRFGVASHGLNHRLDVGRSVGVFLEPNRRFRLPDDHSAPLIMVGAGTGIAPFRAFMQELEQQDRPTPAWLLFGNPHLRTDFLYQREWLRWREQGLVQRIDAAWSRDQEEKRYVQHLVGEQADRLTEWFEQGAHLYLCGALAMGQAVQDKLTESLAGSGLDFETLRRQKRIHRDLY